MPGEPETWPAVLGSLLRGQSLSRDQATWAMREVMRGEATPAQIAGFVVALRAKGETAAEVGGLVAAMLAEAAPVTVEGRTVDTCGTGGDQAHTVNLSTMAAIVVAGAGVPVVKHGGRASSSACGSADLLEELGVVITLPAATVASCLAAAGAVFCFAPVFHPGMRHAAVVRRELGIPTVFNILGPLSNPTRPAAQAVGVSDPRLGPVIAGVLAERGSDALVFRGEDGLDELTLSAPSTVWVVRAGSVSKEQFDPEDLGLSRSPVAALRGGGAAENAAVARAVFGGERGPVRDAVLLNAAAALAAHAGGAAPLLTRLTDGYARAAQALDEGGATRALQRWVEVSRQLAEAPS